MWSKQRRTRSQKAASNSNGRSTSKCGRTQKCSRARVNIPFLRVANVELQDNRWCGSANATATVAAAATAASTAGVGDNGADESEGCERGTDANDIKPSFSDGWNCWNCRSLACNNFVLCDSRVAASALIALETAVYSKPLFQATVTFLLSVAVVVWVHLG